MKYLIVGYGSLMSHNSLKETLRDKHFRLVIVRDFKRVFNLLIDSGKDVLNLVKDSGCKFNGVLFEVDEPELKKLKKREEEYNLEEVNVYDFKSKKKIGKGLICIDYFIGVDKMNKLPDKRYFILCREAAYHISKEFGVFWDKTTYTSNNEQISKWIKKHKEYDSIR